VNLQTRAIIEILADRKSRNRCRVDGLSPGKSRWSSRDRGVDYASAATTGAPQAVQCADRFHVLKNLGEALEGCLARHLAAKRKSQTQDTLENHDPIEKRHGWPDDPPKWRSFEPPYREERLACYEQVVALRKAGHESGEDRRAGRNWPQHGEQMACRFGTGGKKA